MNGEICMPLDKKVDQFIIRKLSSINIVIKALDNIKLYWLIRLKEGR